MPNAKRILPTVVLPIVVKKPTFNEQDHPRGQPDNAGQFGPGGGGKPSSDKPGANPGGNKPSGNKPSNNSATQKPPSKPGDHVVIKPSKKRAFNGDSVPVNNPISKQDAGKIGESVIIAYLISQGATDARHLNLERNNFPIDLVQDHASVEVKTGLVSNGPGAQQWRMTIGEPGKAEKEWLAKANPKEKAAWNAKKQEMITVRKKKALADLSKKLGHTVKAQTMTCLLNPDTKTVDIYQFDGWHNRIGWKSAEAQKAYVGSYTYA